MTAELSATIFNIQHFCIHDGPGIRTGVFFKGCPLRCLWCANPESQLVKPQILWDERKCSRCGACAAVCPEKAVRVQETGVFTEHKLCTGCGVCVSACPGKARELCGETFTVSQVLSQVLEDTIFYGTDGGVTLSGGEALMQAEFASELLRRCREEGVTTALETSGFAPWEKLYDVARYCDTVLYDVKHTDPQEHRRCTGVDNTLILENLRRLSHELPQCDIWLRVPLVPGYNDSEENMLALGELAAELPNCSRVELLPYHNLGEGKRQQLGRTDAFSAETPSPEYLQQLRQLVARSGKQVL